MKTLRLLLWVGLCCGVASQATAVDGVLEINQTCAVNTGCFSGDTAGFPVTINGSAGRSYRLTSDLIVADAFDNGINVATSDIGIDLNNFAIMGAACVGATTSACRPTTGIGSGVFVVDPSNIRGVSVKNGSVIGMGLNGLYLGEQAEVTGVRIRWNRYRGIGVKKSSAVSDNEVFENGDIGIHTEASCKITGNTIYGNGEDGIHTEIGSTVSGNTTYNNSDKGIDASVGSVVSGNTAYGNVGIGIRTAAGTTVSGNVAYSNGSGGIQANVGSTVLDNTAFANTGSGITVFGAATISSNTAYNNGGDGIHAYLGSLVSGNTAVSNGGWGLRLDSDVAYSGNNVTNNTGGTVTSGVNMGGNSCNGTTTCP